ncbi:MAG TPA: PEP-CTERM sorting domain-containing protein [Thiobacillus sp.]|nr:PEP-CTERM sorting domain-containing protein [Thiobacillus sp.]
MITRTAVFLAALTLASTAQAALHDRGGGLIYDDVLNITWLQDANYAKTSGYDADGWLNWYEATVWSASLSYFDTVRNVTWDDWRLPVMIDSGPTGCNWSYGGTDCGYNVNTADSELAHLFFDALGNKSYYDTDGVPTIGDHNALGWLPVNPGPFNNLQELGVYWYGTEYYPNPYPEPLDVWLFSMRDGYQGFNSKGHQRRYAWAVRDGDVAAIPEPETYGMFLAGLGLLAFKLRKR